jgi:hypothetical protein
MNFPDSARANRDLVHLRAVGGPACVAKNRYGITDELPLSWTAFVNALSVTSKE